MCGGPTKCTGTQLLWTHFLLYVYVGMYVCEVIYLFLKERGRDREHKGGGGRVEEEGETQNQKQAPGSKLSAQPDMGLELRNC